MRAAKEPVDAAKDGHRPEPAEAGAYRPGKPAQPAGVRELHRLTGRVEPRWRALLIFSNATQHERTQHVCAQIDKEQEEGWDQQERWS